jgi:lauroyl/myristoyl acyltransferase
MAWRPPQKWLYASQAMDHGWLLAWMARLPLRWAYALARWRGRLNARWSRDWTELSVGFPYISERCTKAYHEMFPTASAKEVVRMVRERYETVSTEDLEGWLAIGGRMGEIQMELEPIRHAMAQRDAGRGLVVVMSHFDNLFYGLAGIARCGYPVYLMTSDVVQDERVHPKLRNFFQLKYEAFNRAMGGGALLHSGSEAKKTFYGVLRQGGIVAVVSETPANPASDKGTWVHWAGRRRMMADGALRMALETGSQLIAMQNWRNVDNAVEWTWSGLVDPRQYPNGDDTLAREAMYAPLFAFLEAGIRAHPGRWWAAHLLGDFKTEPLNAVTVGEPAGSTA